MDKPRVLMIDDEPDFVRLVSDSLTREGFQVTVAEDGIKGLRAAANSRPDIILLDWNLPGKDGLEVCKGLKADSKTRDIPVVMLTVRRKETEVVLGLELGADDYVSKRALRPLELIARMRSVMRRQQSPESPGHILRSGPLSVDTERRRAYMGETVVDLRPKEFDLLCVFLKHKARVLSRHFLEETVWGIEYHGTSRAIDTTVSRLKSKLGAEAKKIQGFKGLGYKFEEE